MYTYVKCAQNRFPLDFPLCVSGASVFELPIHNDRLSLPLAPLLHVTIALMKPLLLFVADVSKVVGRIQARRKCIPSYILHPIIAQTSSTFSTSCLCSRPFHLPRNLSTMNLIALHFAFSIPSRG
jgi:hypothetical protein